MKNLIISFAAILMIAIAAFTLLPRPTIAQQPDALTTERLLLDLTTDDKPFTVEFVEPIARIGKSVNIGPDEDLQINTIGADIVCFLEISINVNQVTCVPYNRVSAIFYEQ